MKDWNGDQAEQLLKEALKVREERARTRRRGSGNKDESNPTFKTSENIVIGHNSEESGISNFGNGASGADFETDGNFIFSNGCNRFGITDFGNMNYKKSSTTLFLLVLVLVLVLLLLYINYR
ncbi:PREDICTED: uncharacterized protein LOC103342998 [Prunus mume]|uniref:Uncharacterized protein LOC103342998 n=1 Tax=Prunus mume TaxID=102107 RepID=A0ABM0PV00_PRUMU|nr:PREDICTED: uncharacterized protein LOC103342998 [Prunus mume]